jgi:hypothetical protein
MPTIKTQNGKVLLKNGKPSCECCDDDGGGGEGGGIATDICPPVLNCLASVNQLSINNPATISSDFANALVAGGTYSVDVKLIASVSYSNVFGTLFTEYNLDLDTTASFVTGTSCGFSRNLFSNGIAAGTTTKTGFLNFSEQLTAFVSVDLSLSRILPTSSFCVSLFHSVSVSENQNTRYQTTDFGSSSVEEASSVSGFGASHFLAVRTFLDDPNAVILSETTPEFSLSLAFSPSAP